LWDLSSNFERKKKKKDKFACRIRFFDRLYSLELPLPFFLSSFFLPRFGTTKP